MIPVEGDPAVASAYAAWNANPCHADRANKVVNEITRLVVGIRNGALRRRRPPGSANVVIVGGDDIVPMARLDDTTRVGNETGTPTSSTSTARTTGRSSTSHFLSDDPYGDLDPIQWATRRLYVPDLAVGRLVETPAQIVAQLDAYWAAGALDASRAYAAGYDFMTDGAQLGAATLEQSLTTANGAPATVTGPRSTRRRGPAPSCSPTWQARRPPSVAAVFGHFDHTGLETPAGDGVDVAADARRHPADGARLVFSMGCHSGLAVSDATVGGGAGR